MLLSADVPPGYERSAEPSPPPFISPEGLVPAVAAALDRVHGALATGEVLLHHPQSLDVRVVFGGVLGLLVFTCCILRCLWNCLMGRTCFSRHSGYRVAGSDEAAREWAAMVAASKKPPPSSRTFSRGVATSHDAGEDDDVDGEDDEDADEDDEEEEGEEGDKEGEEEEDDDEEEGEDEDEDEKLELEAVAVDVQTTAPAPAAASVSEVMHTELADAQEDGQAEEEGARAQETVAWEAGTDDDKKKQLEETPIQQSVQAPVAKLAPPPKARAPKPSRPKKADRDLELWGKTASAVIDPNVICRV